MITNSGFDPGGGTVAETFNGATMHLAFDEVDPGGGSARTIPNLALATPQITDAGPNSTV